MLTDVEAVIFDLDGSLVDSMWIWSSVDVEYLGKFGYEVPEDLQSNIDGMCFDDTAKYIKERFHLEDDIETIKREWTEMAANLYETKVKFKPGVNRVLDYCKRKNIKLGIATSNSRLLLEKVANSLQFKEYFDYILTGCEAKKSKPDPYIYLCVANKLNVNPSKCLVFEDIVPGIMAGKNAGMRVCAVEDAYSRDKKEEKIERADYFINDYFDILIPE